MNQNLFKTVVNKNGEILRQVRSLPGCEYRLAAGESFADKDNHITIWAPLTSQRWQAEVARGYLDEKTGILYSIDDQSMFLRGGKLSMINIALSLKVITMDSPQTVFDNDSKPHEMTTGNYIGLLLRMGSFYEKLYADFCP